MTAQHGTSAVEMKCDHKIPSGKLLRCRAKVENGVIVSIMITGDFFAYPEDVIEKLEAKLIGKNLNDPDITTTVNKALSTDSTIVGFSPNDIVHLLENLKLIQHD